MTQRVLSECLDSQREGISILNFEMEGDNFQINHKNGDLKELRGLGLPLDMCRGRQWY